MTRGITALVGLWTLPFALVASAGSPPARPSPAPRPTPAPVLEGIVKGPDGKPIESALVVAQAVKGTFDATPLGVRTDAQGRFRLPLVRGGTFTVRAEARGFAAWTNEKVRPGASLSIQLEKGLAIQGSVRDGHSGVPVAGARVRIAVGAAPAWEPEAGLVETTTDAQGVFRLDGLPRGLHDVAVRARGYARGLRSNVPAGARVDISLFPGASLSGAVYGPGGAPSSGAVVLLELDTRPSSNARPERADAEGRFAFWGIEPGTYTLVARNTGLAPCVVQGVVVERDSEATTEIVLGPGAAVSGRILGRDETPVSGRVVVQELNGRPLSTALAEMLKAEAARDGRFRLEALPPGSHSLAAFSSGHAPHRADFEVGARTRAVDVGDILLQAGLTIRGRVRDAVGAPVADARIVALPRRILGGSGGSYTEAQSDGDGSFLLDGLSPGTYRLRVQASGYGEQTRSADAGTGRVDFVLQAAGTISGTVVGDSDRPLDGFQVAAEPEAQDDAARPRSKSFGSADGQFVLEDVAEGTYVVQVSAPNHAPAARSDVTVSAGGRTDLGRVRLGRGGVVRGSVTDALGTPLGGATITVQVGGEAMYRRLDPQAMSDPGGNFEVRGVSAGTGVALAQHPEYADGSSAAFDVDPERGPVEARIVLSRGGRVEGSARKRDGTPVVGGVVRSMPSSGGGMSREAPLRADGSFALERVPAGRVRILLMQGEAGLLSSSQSREAEVRDGETTFVEFVQRDILVSGHVRRSGAPAPQLRISLRGHGRSVFRYLGPVHVPAVPAGPQRGTAVTREDGSYEMLVDEPGSTSLVVESLDGRLTLPTRSVVIPDADSFTLNLDFFGTLVTGIVLDKQTEQPVPEATIHADPRTGQDPAGVGWSAAGPDGRFQLELPDGDYRLTANHQGYAAQMLDVRLPGASGELVFTLARGASLQGRVVDLAGRGVANVELTAHTGEGALEAYAWAHSLADGSFRFTSLARRRYNIFAGNGAMGFAVAPGVLPGGQELLLSLRPPGRVQLSVSGPDGAPVEGAYAACVQVDGAFVNDVSENPVTNAQGLVELLLPAGHIQVEVAKENLKATLTIDLTEGATVALEVQLAPS